jgi:hypothetical protein
MPRISQPPFERPTPPIGLNPAAMNTTLLRTITILTLTASHPLPAQNPKSPTPQRPPPETSNKLLEERKAALAEANAVASQAYKAAAVLRQKHNIIDPDPTSDVEGLPKGEAKTGEYLTAKKAYLDAKKALHLAVEAVLVALPPEQLKAEIDAAEMKMARSFTHMTVPLQSGEIVDPDPENPGSVITGQKKTLAAEYAMHKANYLSQKTRLSKLRQLLKSAEGRNGK